MTVITKLSFISKKPKLTNNLLVEKNACEEDKVEIHGPTKPSIRNKRNLRPILYISMLFVLLSLAFVLMALLLNHITIMSLSDRIHRCAILIPNDAKGANLENVKKAIQDSSKQFKTVKMISTNNHFPNDEYADALREDLDFQGPYEKITVISSGRLVDFLHDFDENTTTIVDKDRCFVMTLKPEWVLPPAEFLAALRRGDALDVARERRPLRAAPARAPPPPPPAPLLDCVKLPTYELFPDDADNGDEVSVFKRSVEGAAADAGAEYLHFAGRRVQEIHITNLPELLQREAAQH